MTCVTRWYDYTHLAGFTVEAKLTLYLCYVSPKQCRHVEGAQRLKHLPSLCTKTMQIAPSQT